MDQDWRSNWLLKSRKSGKKSIAIYRTPYNDNSQKYNLGFIERYPWTTKLFPF